MASNKRLQIMQQKRATLLKEALHLFSELGYYDTTIQKIAKASKVSFGSVFTYFESKEALFHAVVAEPLQAYAADILKFDTEPDDPLEEIKRMVYVHLHQFAQMGTYLRMVQQVIGQHNKFAEQFALLDQFHKEFLHKLTLLIESGQKKGQLKPSDAQKTAITYTSFLMGLRLIVTDEPDDPMWEQFVPCGVQIFGPM